MSSRLLWITLGLPAIVFSQSTSQTTSRPTDDCPILGPNFASDFNISQSNFTAKAIDEFPTIVEQLFESGQLLSNVTAFYIDVFSTQTKASIYNYAYSAELLKPALTAGLLDDSTIMRIGSVSKLFTVYTLLNAAGIDIFQDHVTDYLPELKGNTEPGKIKWDEITVGALASQQGGTGGFPLDIPLCLEYGNCDVQAFLAKMRDAQASVIPVFHDALYSDAGFGVLGRVIERITNQTYEDALQTYLAKPLGLNYTGTTEPASDGLNALAIPGNFTVSSWGQDNHITSSSGGVYSNANDLRLLGLSILQNRLLSEDITRKWMKPLSHTSSLTTSVGAPWEINRLSIPVSPGSNRTRVSDLYTKLGGQVGYTTVFALSPDHGIGYSILIAGVGTAPTIARVLLRDAVGETFIPAAEAAAFENARVKYAGTFADPDNELSNLTLTVDQDKPGLGLASLFVDGVDWSGNITGNFQPPSDRFSYRLYPTGGQYTSASNGALVKQYAAVYSLAAGAPRSYVEGGKGLFDDGCISWEEVGFYNTTQFDLEVVDGKLMAVRMFAAQVTMTRV